MATCIGAPPSAQEDEVIIGKKRPQGNPLIGHYEVGRSWHARLSPHYDDPQYTYGMALKRDTEGAGDVVLSWKGHVQSPPPKGGASKDFVRMNKRAAASHCVSPRETSEFRKTHELHVPRSRATKDRSVPKAVRDPAMVFGRRTPGEVSVGELIANKFETEWIEQQRAHEQRERQARRALLQKKSRNRRQFMHRPPEQEAPLHPKEYFTMKKFRQVHSRFASATPEPERSAPLLPPISCTPDPEPSAA
eukprot:TRINITY_DN55307_c0_g1_i1.p1 TRINITY_DN55307_c0_g1~~TRINITY_DN55307_c0_g1_i1.p1  ORF type:complete len:248 (+),score=86.41 TRINITY_DN55307_c0_g1_i1:112-855(+)